MYQIKGEGLFVGAGFIAEGWKVADNLRKIGFNVTVTEQQVFKDPKLVRYIFEACSNNDRIV